ncbi:hypothetical protein BSKO_10916 [Bryopsis sp. KO-2023]|nr:hypothetical protein BSKO_10916 [Bryopsis sp. KO-2023]
MSNIYNLEPPTKGKVMLLTSLGEIEIELWPKEAPMAVRNFVQLCLESYYDGTLFHRIIEGFMIQGGDPTGTGEGGESIYGRPFKDEFHSRLRFTHRGLVACANQNEPNTNGSQFFITLEKCDDLNKRYTIFGKVVGDTIYNVTRIGEVLTDAENRPLDPICVKKVEVVWNPFEDIVPRVSAKNAESEKDEAKKEKTRKGKKDFKLLSFGEEAEEDEVQIAGEPPLKIRSAHDALVSDEKLVTNNSKEAEELKQREAAELQARLQHVRARLVTGKKAEQSAGEGGVSGEGLDRESEANLSFDEKMKARVAAMHAKRASEKSRTEGNPEPPTSSGAPVDEDSRSGGGPIPPTDEKLSKNSEKKLHLKRKSIRAEDVKDADLLTASQVRRAKLKRRKQLNGEREVDTLARLAKFKTALASSKNPTPQPDVFIHGPSVSKSGGETQPDGGILAENSPMVKKEEEEEEDRTDIPASWRIDEYLQEGEEVGLVDLRSHRLEFKGAKAGKDEMQRRDDVNDYVVFDPLLEAGKSKFNKKQNMAKRKEREWSSARPVG